MILSTSYGYPENYFTTNSRATFDRRPLERSTPREPFKFSSARANTSRLSTTRNPLRSVFVSERRYVRVDSLDWTRTERRPEAGARFPDEPVVGNTGWVLVGYSCVVSATWPGPEYPSSCPHPAANGRRADRRRWLLLAAGPSWGSRGLQRWWWMISSPLPRASWYAWLTSPDLPYLYWLGRGVHQVNEDRCTWQEG